MHNTGFIFTASGDHYLKACVASARSIKQQMPQARITVFTDTPEYFAYDLFEHVVPIAYDSSRVYSIKPDNIYKSPYDRSIFLDCDTYVCSDLTNVFEILDVVDMAMPFSFYRYGKVLPSLSSSMIVFRNSDAVSKVFHNWQQKYNAKSALNPMIGDQDFLSEALYESTARFTVLPPEYHAHSNIMNGLHGKISVVTTHAYHEAEDLSSFLNSNKLHRIYIPVLRKLITDNVDASGITKENREITVTERKV